MDEFEQQFGHDLGPLFQLATSLHQMYVNLRQAGFTEQQALYLTGKMIHYTEPDITMEGE